MELADKILLTSDLSSRLLYHPLCKLEGYDKPCKLISIEVDDIDGVLLDFVMENEDDTIQVYINEVKPYLRPMSSMTEDEENVLFSLCRFYTEEDWEGKKREAYGIEIASRPDPAYSYDNSFNLYGVDMGVIEWFNVNHFDYRGLIKQRLALEAPQDMY